MSDGEEAVWLRLLADMGLISSRLVGAFHLSKPVDSGHHAAITRWLDFRFRYVEPRPRVVLKSDQFPKRLLPEPVKTGLEQLMRKFESGEDVNPYQGKGIKNGKTGGAPGASRFRTDLLFADWGISHFHVTAEPLQKGQRFSKRSGWLAFCMVAQDQVAFIDVVRHPSKENLEFSDPELLSTALRSWPDAFEKYRNDRLSADSSLTMHHIHTLRQNNTNTSFNYEGLSYIGPGGGIMANGTLARVYMHVMMFQRRLRALAKGLVDPSEQFLNHSCVVDVEQPKFSMKLHNDGLGIYESNSRVLFGGASDDVSEDVYWLRWMSDLFIPPWAVAKVISSEGEFFSDLLCQQTVD